MSQWSVTETVADQEPRCPACGKLLAELLTRPWRIRCSRCKATVQDGVLDSTS